MTPGKGGWLGEFHDPNRAADYWTRPHPALGRHTCISDRCRVMALKRRELHDTLAANPRLAQEATRAEVDDLWGKVMHMRSPAP